MTKVDMGAIADGHHRQSFCIYYEDTDAGEVVYHANYLRFCERARSNVLKLLDIHQSDLKAKDGVFFVVSKCEITFKRPAMLDDIITVQTQLIGLKKTRMTLAQDIYKDDRIICAVKVEIVMVNTDIRPTPIPPHVYDAMTTNLTVQGE